MSDDPSRFTSKLFDACVGILLASMALYGAVQVLTAIWVPLSITIFVVAVIGTGIWFFVRRDSRW